MKKILLFVGVLLFSLVCVSCGDDSGSTDSVEIKGITISSAENLRSISVGQTLQLTATVYPTEASQEVTWTSEDAQVATVSDAGLVTGAAVGTVNIKATSKADTTVSQTFALIITEAPEVVVTPESVTVSSLDGRTTCKAGETIALVAYVLPREASQNVIWTSSDTTVATVSRGEVTALKAGTVTITATAKGYDTVSATITLTIEAADRPIVSGDWASMPFSTHADFISCSDETKIKIKGVVTHINPVKDGEVSYFIQNGEDGYYVYAQDSVLYPVELDKVYEVGGYKKLYRGLNEITNVEYFVASNDNITATTVSLNDKNPTNKEAMRVYQGALVSATGSFVSGTVKTNGAFSITVNINGYDTTLRIDPSYAGQEEFSKLVEIFEKAIVGASLELVGFMTEFGYSNSSTSPQIQITKASDVVFAEITPEEFLEACATKLTISPSIGFNKEEIELVSSVTGFDGVAISWSSNNAAIDAETGKVTHSSEDVTVKLTATLKFEDITIERVFTVVVQAVDNVEREVLVSLDLEDAALEGQYGCSATKPAYAEGVVQLGTPKTNWLLRNALIGYSDSDKVEGRLSIRAKSGAYAEGTARIEVQVAGEYNVVQFAGAAYGNHVLTSQVRIEYTFDNGATWLVADTIITLDSATLQTYRVNLPEGVKRIAIVVVENSGKTVNIDSIKLMK